MINQQSAAKEKKKSGFFIFHKILTALVLFISRFTTITEI